jgi:hypothetical protein
MADTYEFRFRRRYGLPPTDPRFLDATYEEIVTDFWAHAHMDDPKLRKEQITDNFEEERDAMEAEIMARIAAEEAAALERGEVPEPPPEPAPAPYVRPEVPQEMVDDFEEIFADRY